MEIAHAPADRLANEKATNTQRVSSLDTLTTKISALQTATTALSAGGLFGGRIATLGTAGSTWTAQASANTAAGAYKVTVAQLATSARRDGAADIGRGLAATSDVSGLTLATLPVATPVTAGTFTVNAAKVTVKLSDSLQDVFDAISEATDGAVTASYDPAADKITLSSAEGTEVMLGAANDTSNFLRALKLGNNGAETVTSSATLGTLKPASALKNANLAGAVSAVDQNGAGKFSINGVEIAFNVNTDSLNTVIARINASNAGVSASYDAAHDRMVLANGATGDLGIALRESDGGLLAGLGLTTGATFTRGRNAEFTINDGETLTSTSNVLDASTHGISGLTIQVTGEETQTVTVGADTDAMRKAIDNFISAYNDVQSYIDSATKVSTDSKGKVTAAVLSNNREVQAWSDSLRALAFAAVSGSGSIKRIESLGLDFKPGSSQLEVDDEEKLTAALRDNATDVAAFFQTGTTGFSAKITSYLDTVSDLASTQQKNLNKTNTQIDDQIAAIERRLEQQRAVMESAFINMESAQATLKTQQAALDRAFSSTSSSSS